MTNTYPTSRDYTKPAIDQRIAELVKRRIGAREDLPTESTKERLTKFKEIRNARQGLLKITHRHVLEMVAYILNTDVETLEEGVLDKDEYVNVFSSFFVDGGREAIVIHFQPMSPPVFESGRWTPQLSKEQYVTRCCITDGTTEEFSGKCVIVYRLKSNLEFGVKQLLDWGELSKSETGEKIKDDFIGDFKDFCEFLSMTKIDLENVICFQINWDLYQKCLALLENIKESLHKPSVIEAVEADVQIWMKLMERAVVESQQLRRETETVGPSAELAYWRRLLARFSSIINHIKSAYTQSFIQLLTEAKSKLIMKWKELEEHVIMIHILSQDNVKYLYGLEKFTHPLYRLDPTKIGDYLPALMYAIRMIYVTSRFFNTRKMVTAIYVKITNQMILACKAYLTENGKLSIWDESKCTMISKIKDCIKLCDTYHDCYDGMCKRVEESPEEKPFELSEMYVFGKFGTFKTRIIKIMDILEAARMYSILHSSTVEGIDTYAEKYSNYFKTISSQTYDPLDHRKPYFDADYDEFKKNIAETDLELRTFFHNCVSLVPNITQALWLIDRFQKLNLKQLRIDRKCSELITMFEREIEDVRDRYNEDRSDLPIPRNIPPIVGRILWIRQLYKRIEVPMNMFRSHQRVLAHEPMQKCIKIYNALVSVFIHYELIYHKAWYDAANIVRLALSSPILVRHPKTNKYCLNFDSYIYEVIRESEHMSKFELEVPEFIQILIFCKEKIFSSYETVKELLKRNDALRKSIPIVFLNLMKIALIDLEIAFQPCLSVITWSSLKLPKVCGKIKEAIENAQIFIKEVKDMKEARVDEVFESIAKTTLLELENPKSPEQLLADTIASRNKIAVDLEIKSAAAEKTVIMIINKFMDVETDPAVQDVKYNWLDLEKVHKQVGSETRLIQAPYEPAGDNTSLNSYFQSVSDHKEIIRSTMSLQGLILILRDDVSKVGNSYLRYSYIWAENRNEIIQAFVDSKPLIQEIKEKFMEYEDLLTEIQNLPARHVLGPLQIDTAVAWMKSLGVMLSNKYKEKLQNIIDYINEKNKVLSRNIKDLEDVRVAMKCLAEIRDDFISLDMELILIEETYTLMGKFNIDILKEDQDIVDGLRYNFSNMLQMAKQVQAVICEMQEPLKKELTDGVAVLRTDVAEFDIDFELSGPMVEGIPAKEASERLILFQARFDELWEGYETLSSGESLFGIEVTEYPVLHQRKREINLLQKLYTLYLQVMRTIDSYYDIPWSEIDIESIITELADFQNRCRRLPKAMREWPAYIDLKKKIDDFNEMCPLLEMMANKAMKDRHWERLSKLCQYFFDVESETFTLANVMQAPLLKYKDDVEDICISAVKELDIETKLKQIIADWAVVNLQFASFKQRGELLLKGVETAEIIAQLEDSLMIISSLLANRYNVPFKKEIQLWQTKLSNTSEILAKWLIVQNLWAYLEAVFIGGDISKQLPTEAKRFNAIDKSWVKLMLRAHEKLNAVETCTEDETMSQFLPHLLEQLESCQKSLSGYLETKRVIFPRFCFISDPTLLEILGQAADCHTIQNYLDGFFDNIAKLAFAEKEYEKIVAMYSRENEKIELEKSVICVGGMENWVNTLLTVHQQSVGAVISLGLQSLRTPEFDILSLIENSVLQVGLLALQVLWTRDSEIAVTMAKRDRTIMKRTNQWFLDLLNSLIGITVKDLTKYARVKYEALITIHVHQRDIFDELCRLRIRSIHDFEWLKQCRFYYDEDSEEVPIRITDVEFVYQNEFLGCTDRLAITPLTDRCYITLAQAVGMNFGGAPAGPAGTGKTETTKDMGKALGKYVVVFNCSDQMDFRGLGRIFKGLAQSGSWGCFDEFNRIDLPVLSVAAQQIAIVLNARKEKKTTFLFSDGETYKLNYEFGIIITMNPGYAGRQELPENLKIQFRSVAMMIPDRQIIMRVKLAACGFKENVVLARKFFMLYKLCEEQLSKQVHYDFGLRNILSCLRTLGAQRRANPGDSEETTLMRVLRSTQTKKTENLWMVLDGPVDAVWIENLNSVLDDNKTLTLANGDRIIMAPNAKLVFEPDNVDNASPATISRMGMVFFSASVLQWTPILESWLKTCSPNEAEVLQVLPVHHIEKLFLFSLMWSLGAVLELDGRLALQEYLVNHESNCNWPKYAEDETIFEYLVSEDGKWIHWIKMVPEFEYPSDREQGTAKTVIMKSYMSKHDPEYHLNKFFNFSSASTPNMVQRVFESYVEKRVGTTYGPAGGRKMTIFIDDINMPDINEWGDQITNEVVRQLMEYKGFYSLDKPGDFCTMQDIMLLAAMIHPGGGRNDIPPRLKRQFNIFNCTLPSNRSMDTIFSAIGQGYFCTTRFSEDIVNFLPRLVPLTRILWQRTKMKMLPTPAKFHYVFNLRDLSRIWEGILRIERAECESITSLLKLWEHECTRVIADRFTTAADKEWFQNTLRRTAEKILGPDFQHYSPIETYFVNFLREPPEPTGDEPEDFVLEAPKIYEEIPSYEIVIEKVQQNMEQFNEYIRGMRLDLVFFHDALVHLMRISRILGVPRGNAMLVGVGGSGKQSLTRLASFIAGFNFFQITLTRRVLKIYNVASLMDDLRRLYRIAGTGNRGLTFIFTDNEIKEEAFLEYINNVLSVGEVANLFPKDELDDILTIVTPMMKKDDPRRPPTQDNLYDYFISRARNNLHIVLCFSPVGGKFRSRSLKFPGLISGCTMNWFLRWPKDALYAVGEHFLETYKVVCSPEVKQQLMQVVGDIQDDVNNTCAEYFDRFRRQVYVTPKSFLTFLDNYKALYKQHLDNINTLASRMSNGLNKLIDAAAQVDVLRKELERNQEEIAEKNVQVEAILVNVNEKKMEAENVRAKVQMSKDEAEAILEVIAKDKAVAEEKLKAAEPALLEAEAALQTIKPVDIATVRKLAKPPYLIMLIMDCVLILFGRKLEPVKPDYEHQFLIPSWSESLKVMADARFLHNLQHFPKDNINAETVDLMMPYLNYHMYTYEAALQACGNVAGLIQWTISMVTFYGINKDVLPLKANLAVQENKYEKANKNLLVAEKILKEKDDDLQAVQSEFDAVMRERQIIIDQAAICQAKMDMATAMIEGLSGERVRWTEQLVMFKSEIDRLVGDVLVLTGFLSYCGSFNQEFRVLLQRKWFDFIQDRKIPISVTVNIVNALTDTATIGDWSLQGLPTDELSVQNGIIVTKATRYPLLIDPQLQGKTWIKNKETEFNLQITWFTHKYFRNHLEDCVSIGRPLLIEDVEEEIDPILDNLLEKNFIKIGTSLKVKIGDKEVDVSRDFRFYITTKLPNPFYTPEIFARTAIIDFTVTMKGLEDQLLGRVILTERKELETEKKQLIADVTANKRKIKELEENLLHKLATVQGPLIEDVELMSVLNITKQTAADVTEKLSSAKDTELKIDTAREEFRPVATRGSVLYFLICDMPHVNCMYQTSLVQFLERFDISMARSEKSPVNQRRINHIIEYLTYDVFKYKARGLYEIHKYMFILLMTLKIDLQRGSITHEEFQYLIKGGAALDLKAVEPKSCKWITDVTWLNLVALSSLRQFQYIVSQVPASEKVWKHWFDKDAPEEEIIPDGYNTLDAFRRLLLIRAWCMDRALSQSRKYIASSLGAKYAEPVITLLDAMYNESRPNTPMICFLSMGSDPTPSIEQLAKRLEIVCRSVSMGQGQEVHARRLLNSAKTEGYWALCQNCHLGLEYMAELANFLLEMEAPHPQFRVWITTEPHRDFPISLLQMSIKYTYEPPQGIRAGLLATYSGMNQEMLDQCDAAQYIPLIYTVSFLHTVVQERRKFGPLGWNIPYEFNSADWLASCTFINNHLNDYDPKRGINWQIVRYMIGEVQYGGRVTDDYDKRLLNTFAKVWFADALFAEGFAFYKGYPLLIFKLVSEYLKAIDTMSTIDPPQVYGLHPNADITYQSNTTQTVLDTIISLQPKEAGVVDAEPREVVVTRQAKEMLEKIPAVYDMFEVKERLRAMGHTAPMNIFLKQEIDRLQVVIKLVRSMLKDLLLAIEGVIIMSQELRDALDNIYDARIPKAWKARSWESASLGFWFTELLERNQQFSSWLYSGRPSKFWMTGFFNPQGFLTAMKQEVTRAHKGWALDNVTLHNEVLRNMAEEVRTPPLGSRGEEGAILPPRKLPDPKFFLDNTVSTMLGLSKFFLVVALLQDGGTPAS
ncbi:hypothetical protein DMN91_002318 [Ooceraea biroi]|uniref:Dynein heavy chain 8, axonemal n=1 Tax=Ooceraea biroi TaxID=2015173 RepID=A0A3L8E0V3_OOCBI|nr:hypothetical protein DMN91_002318 [Ooceraea biroi]